MKNRRSIRLKGYDYSQEGLYFITICTENHTCHFGNIKNEQMILNQNGTFVKQCWEAIPEHFPNVVLHEYVVMPNHIQGILEIVGTNHHSPETVRAKNVSLETVRAKNVSPLQSSQCPIGTSKTIGSIVRGFKIGVTKLMGISIWQRNYYEHIIRNWNAYVNISEYIINNPKKWADDKFYKNEMDEKCFDISAEKYFDNAVEKCFAPTLVGPFTQLLTMDNLPLRGRLSDDQLEIIPNGGILHADGKILAVGNFEALRNENPDAEIHFLEGENVCLPGMIDVHTHICWAGSRARDYAMRLEGKTYLEIAQAGGGIWDTVQKTRNASVEELTEITVAHAEKLYAQGVTTIEVKSGYGLSVDDELKMLEAIQLANEKTRAELVPTCLAAHIKPKDFAGNEREYLEYLVENLLPEIKLRKLANRVDIFVEKGAFSIADAKYYLAEAKKMGFDVVIHGDQFSNDCATLAVEFQAVSIDHLEYADDKEIAVLAKSNVIPVALPGASLGLGERFAPARKLLDAGCSLVIASDWNPGSAPMGNLLVQAAVLGAYEKLSMAETWAALTCRAAQALKRNGVGILKKGNKADFIVFETGDFREILYRQMIPSH